MQEELLAIYADYLDTVDYLQNEQRDRLMEMARQAEQCIAFCYACIACIEGEKESAECGEQGLGLEKRGEQYCLIYKGYEMLFTKETVKNLLVHFLDLFEPVYPIGTIVDLKESLSRRLKLPEPVQKVRVAIVDRFTVLQNHTTYFPYMGIVYPVGVMGKGKFLYFTNALIDEVIHMGYRDETEDAYVLLMKKELLLESQAVSFGFLDKERASRYAKELGVDSNG